MEQLDNEFYHEDFTIESPWEEFNAKLLELFSKWQLANMEDYSRKNSVPSIYNCNWHIEEETLKYLDDSLTITYYRSEDLPAGNENDLKLDLTTAPIITDLLHFCENFALPDVEVEDSNNLWNIFGLQRFVVIRPTMPTANISTSMVTLILSSIATVSAEIESAVAVFLQIRHDNYMGMSLYAEMRTDYSVSSWKQQENLCNQYSSLHFLSSLFREKAFPRQPTRAITVSIRQTYSVGEKRHLPTPIQYKPWYENSGLLANIVLPFDVALDEHLSLPLGFKNNLKSDMCTIFTWPSMDERMLTDFTVGPTNLRPSKASRVFFSVDVEVIGYLSDCLQTYEAFNGQKHSIDLDNESFVWYLSPVLTQHSHDPEFWDNEQQEQKIAHLLEYWSKHSYAKEIKHSSDDLQIEEYLFPSSEGDQFAYKSITREELDDAQRLKSAPYNSLVSRLSCMLAYYWSKSNIKYWYMTWRCFATQISLHWDVGKLIPGVAPGPPDRRTCLLHQKLQMLNLCIAERQRRQSVDQSKGKEKGDVEKLGENGEDDEDEFLDCNDEDMVMVDTIKPEGRLKPLHQLKLLNGKDDLYEPITMEPPPETEDRLVLAEEKILNSSQSQADFSQSVQRSLISDMSAFKAANPQGYFEDFIRWYSPRDWQESSGDEDDEEKTFGLSPRMSVAGNIWQKLWENAMPVPASEQIKHNLGDLEAIRVISFIESSSKSYYIYELTIVPLLHTALVLYRNILTKLNVLDVFEESLEGIRQELCTRARQLTVDGLGRATSPIPRFYNVIDKFRKLETDFYKWLYLEKAFSDVSESVTKEEVKRFFRELQQSEGGYIEISDKYAMNGGGDAGVSLKEYVNPFCSETVFPQSRLVCSDYLLWDKAAFSDADKCMPQFLRAKLWEDNVQLCGAFTEHTTLFQIR